MKTAKRILKLVLCLAALMAICFVIVAMDRQASEHRYDRQIPVILAILAGEEVDLTSRMDMQERIRIDPGFRQALKEAGLTDEEINLAKSDEFLKIRRHK